MREIKFRFWDKNKKLWLDPAMLAVTGCGEIFSTETLEFLPDIDVLNYTGLKGDNDIEIYEGDVIRFGQHLWEVGFQHACFRAYNLTDEKQKNRWYTPDDLSLGSMDDTLLNVEVIGNIYENPELLEVEK